jgi:hypothetical protein
MRVADQDSLDGSELVGQVSYVLKFDCPHF